MILVRTYIHVYVANETFCEFKRKNYTILRKASFAISDTMLAEATEYADCTPLE